jgi:hypothetical protein
MTITNPNLEICADWRHWGSFGANGGAEGARSVHARGEGRCCTETSVGTDWLSVLDVWGGHVRSRWPVCCSADWQRPETGGWQLNAGEREQLDWAVIRNTAWEGFGTCDILHLTVPKHVPWEGWVPPGVVICDMTLIFPLAFLIMLSWFCMAYEISSCLSWKS